MPNIYSLISRKAAGLTLAALSMSLVSMLPASAQSFDTSQVGGVTMGANGPQGFLSMPNVPQVINVPQGGGPGFSIVGGSQADRSMAATGEQYHDSEITGPQALRADGDYSSNKTSRSNPVRGMGSNFGLSKTEIADLQLKDTVSGRGAFCSRTKSKRKHWWTRQKRECWNK